MLIDRDKAILKCQERLYESALNNVGIECKADEVFSDIAQNRIETWLNELPSAESEAYNLGWKESREALRKEIWEDGRDRLD